MKKWETIVLDGVIQMTSEKAEEQRWITMSSVPLLQSRTMKRFPNLAPNDEGSLWRLLSLSSKLPHVLVLSVSEM